MAEKVVPIVQRLEQESPKEAIRVKEKLRADHGLDVDKLMALYKLFGKNFVVASMIQ